MVAIGDDGTTPRMSNRIQHLRRNARGEYKQLNTVCPRCKNPLLRKSVDAKFSFQDFQGLTSATEDSMERAILENQTRKTASSSPRHRSIFNRMCFSSTALLPHAEDEDVALNCCGPTTKATENAAEIIPFSSVDNMQFSMRDTRLHTEDACQKVDRNTHDTEINISDKENNVDIRSMLPFCMKCQAYVATERVISEQQEALSDLIDRLALDDDETVAMSLYIDNDVENTCPSDHENIPNDDEVPTEAPLPSTDDEEIQDSSFAGSSSLLTTSTDQGLSTVNENQIYFAAENERNFDQAISDGDIDTKSAGEEDFQTFENYDPDAIAEEVQKNQLPPMIMETNYLATDYPLGRVPMETNYLGTDSPLGRDPVSVAGVPYAFDRITRREIAAKAIGTRLIEGYRLTDVTCENCGVPLMERDGSLECVACPCVSPEMHYSPRGFQLYTDSSGEQGQMNVFSGAILESEPNTSLSDESISKPAARTVKFAGAATMPFTDDLEDSNDMAAKAIGRKLVEGYIITDIICDNCGLPCLERDGSIECATCHGPSIQTADQGRTSRSSKVRFQQDLAETNARDIAETTDDSESYYIFESRKGSKGKTRRKLPATTHPSAAEVEAHSSEVYAPAPDQEQYHAPRLARKKSAKKRSRRRSTSRQKDVESFSVVKGETEDTLSWWAAAVSAEESRLEDIATQRASTSERVEPPYESSSDHGSPNDELFHDGNKKFDPKERTETSSNGDRRVPDARTSSFDLSDEYYSPRRQSTIVHPDGRLGSKDFDDHTASSTRRKDAARNAQTSKLMNRNFETKERIQTSLNGERQVPVALTSSFDFSDEYYSPRRQSNNVHPDGRLGSNDFDDHSASSTGLKNAARDAETSKLSNGTHTTEGRPSYASNFDQGLLINKGSHQEVQKNSIGERTGRARPPNPPENIFSTRRQNVVPSTSDGSPMGQGFPKLDDRSTPVCKNPSKVEVSNGNNTSLSIGREDVLAHDRCERTSSEICRRLGSGWKLTDVHCNKCIMPMMQNNQGTLTCVACEQEQTDQSPLRDPSRAWAHNTITTSNPSSIMPLSPPADLGIGKKLLEGWSLVTTRTCKCGSPMMKAPRAKNEVCINLDCSCGRFSNYPEEVVVYKNNERNMGDKREIASPKSPLGGYSSGDLSFDGNERSYEKALHRLQHLSEMLNRSESSDHDSYNFDSIAEGRRRDKGILTGNESSVEGLEEILEKVEATRHKLMKITGQWDSASGKMAKNRESNIESKLLAQMEMAEILDSFALNPNA